MRAQLNESQRQQHASSAAAILTAHPLFIESRHIACYYAVGHEFETDSIIKAVWQAGKSCYLPTLADGKSLHFAQYNQGDELQLNQHSIPEPVNSSHPVAADKLDLVLVPLLAFDLAGSRVGAGGGYYDRTFAFMYVKQQKGPFLLGLGFELQQSTDIHAEPWDVKLNGVLTEHNLLIF